jgi:uncharacterized coiled-coil protein SlyX
MLAEDLADALNTTVYHQQRHIEALRKAVGELNRQLRAAQGRQGDASLRAEDEIPPHW